MRVVLDNINKRYKERFVLKDINCVFESGNLYVIKGVSGCGKTTLLNLIGDLDQDYEGDKRVYKDSLEPYSVSYMFQNSLLIASLSVGDNLRLVCDDRQRIENISTRLGIGKLLSNYPSVLSGGERQRAALARALIKEPDILLCDEPTASLDYDNSVRIAELISQAKNEDRIILIATHDDCFDAFADVILHLDYGRLEGGVYESANEQTVSVKRKELKTKGEGKLRYAFLHCQSKLRFFSLLPLAFIFFFVLAMSAAHTHFENLYYHYMKSKYPLDMLTMGVGYSDLPFEDRMIFYENYMVSDKGVEAFYLPDRNASIFLISSMILYGHFPENDGEILVTPGYVKARLDGLTPEEAVGKETVIADTVFIIAGIAAPADQSPGSEYYMEDVYYRRNVKEAAAFIPYNSIRKIGTVSASPYRAGYLPGISENKHERVILENRLRSSINGFFFKMAGQQELLDRAVQYAMFLLIFGTVVASLFYSFVVSAELFYRKKELGYLQIFGLSKRSIRSMVNMEYLIKITAALFVAVVFFLTGLCITRCVTGFWIWPAPKSAGLLLLLMLGSYQITAAIATRIFLRRNVRDLIG